jgi:phosphatidylserine decarboxylase
VLQEFKELIEKNTRVYMLFQSMFQEVPKKKPYRDEPTGHPQIRDYHHLLQVLNHVLKSAPCWNDRSKRVGLVGVPIQAILDWPMGTPSGFAAFLDPDVNAMLRKVLNAWNEYLSSPESACVLDDSASGWFSEHGINELAAVANVGDTSYTFDQLFECDPTKPHHGFKSWDHFFTRTFREDVRPVAEPDNDKVIANACESLPYNVATGVKARDQFWIKSQPYSILDMLAHDPSAEQFTGGTVYQAFLSALSYHRWHAPVGGKVVNAYVVPGTYYSEPLFEGLGDPDTGTPHGIDIGAETTSQGYLTATATRALIFIESEDPAVGLVAFVGVGMAEVSTCEITVSKGQKVKKGDQIGMFHFGGSTHCLVFRKGVRVSGFPQPGREENVPVRSELAVVS